MTEEATREYRLFKRREKAVTGGARLPTEEELLRGMPFFRNDLTSDMREYGERLARRLRKRQRIDLQLIVSCLEELAVEQSLDSLRAFEASLDDAPDIPGIPVKAARLRCLVYRAGFGDPDATAAIAGEMAQLALKDARTTHKPRMLWCSLSWLAFSRDMAEQQAEGRYRGYSRGIEFNHELRSYVYLFKNAILEAKPEEETQETAPKESALEFEIDEPSPAAEAPPEGHVIVLREVGNATVSQGKDVAKEFKNITGVPLPVPPVPDLATVRANLVADFPYATTVVDQVLKGLVGRQHLRLRPTILLGPPGCGKSRFARRLTEELSAPYELIPCGGMNDSALGGTPRRWSSGEPSLPMLVVRRHECAGPVIILDEIDKVGTDRHNGNAHDVLLGLLEPETARQWQDPYVQAGCDLSNLTWLMTANQIEPVPTVLRDRCRVLRFPEPGPQHLPIIAVRIMERLYVERGHDPRWATPLEGFELEAITAVWSGGSIRRLERIVEQLVDVREEERSAQ